MLLKASMAFLLLVSLLSMASPAASSPLPQGEEIRVSQLEDVLNRRPQVAVFPDGGFVVAWTVGPTNLLGRSVIHARFFKKDGTPAGGQFRLVDRYGDSQELDQIAAAPDGSFLVVWSEEFEARRDVFVRRYNRNGKPLSSRIPVGDPQKPHRYRGVIAVFSNGRFAVAWRADVDLQPSSRSYSNAVARIFNAQGTPLTKEFIVGEGAPGIGDDNVYSDPLALTLAPDSSLIVQLQDLLSPDVYQNYVRRFSAKGKLKRTSILSNPVSCCVDSPGGFLGMGPDGSFVVTWSESDLRARRFAPNGAPQGPAFWVSKSPESAQKAPAVALVPGGASIIIWQENGRDGAGGGIFGRVFASDRMPLSDDFQINTTAAGSQINPAIAANSQGRAVVVWTTNDAVFARLLAP